MADDSTIKTISSTDSGFPAYLNFDTLRSDAIAYLGNLTGKIWTDYNVHDPGITILEVLVYAVLDLGYRTNLPVVDLLTRAPGDTSKDNNFFTPAQILSNNPLTIMDFRKMLIDISGVKNAWLEVEDSLPTNPCKNDTSIPGAVLNLPKGNCDCDFLNGLYHVFIELENDYGPIKATATETDDYSDIIYKIKCALMGHRNLCEDFIDIKILCKLHIGLCADIELAPDAVGEDVYLSILEALRDFFSPAPRFYTLPQLLDKGKSIEEIFAGRPYNLKESYGFVDTDEFEEIVLRKKMHLSDVYHVLFDIKGVKNVRNLAWNLCNNPGPQPVIFNKWELQLPENYIPVFDVSCSGFQFFNYGMKVKPDTSKANAVFEMNFSGNGKILYTQPSPNLDAVIPQGVYRSDLADYNSIQNEFPHVYGIKDGDLSANAPDQRKAQALQLQGFLLFFDQLLANYLTQLKNIRSLFALSSSAQQDQNHTYFTNTLTDVPQLEKLLRFNTGDDGASTLGSEGTTLAYPTSRKNLEDLIASGKIQNTDLDRRCNDINKDDFPPYEFCYGAVRDQAENQLRDDLLNGDFEPVVLANYNNCYFFYCFTSSTDFALISKKYYSSEREAQTAAASIKYLATFAENYRNFIIDDNPANQYLSFDIELNLSAYSNYLQLIAEDASLYTERRQGFLNHLLARFAEQFSDYALITSGFLTPDQLAKARIKKEEKFLANYPDLSSNRGKAYDYKCDGWNNENISGFEKRVKALSGIDNWQKHYLCNFVVEQADEIYQLSISLFGSAFEVNDKMFTYAGGYSSLTSLYKKLAENPSLETEYLAHEQKWSVFIKDDYGNKYSDQNLYNSKEEAQAYISSVQSIVTDKPDAGTKVFVSKYIYKLLFEASSGEVIEETKEKFDSPADAQKYFDKINSKLANYLNDSKAFTKTRKGTSLQKLILIKNENYNAFYIDPDKFEFKPVDVIQLDSVKKKFALLNDQKTIQFDSLINYDTVKLAEAGFQNLIGLLASSGNYVAQKDNGDNTFKIKINDGKNDAALYFQSFNTEEDAQNKIKDIFNEISSHTYHLLLSDPVADNWEFKYELTNPGGANIEFTTQAAYTTEVQAQAAAKQFYAHVPTLKMQSVKKDLQLVLDNKKQIVAHASLADPTAENASQLLQQHQQLFTAINNPNKKFIDATLSAGKEGNVDQYVYKLVDKDHLLAKSNYILADQTAANNKRNDLINTIQAGYDYTKLSFGNDVIDKRIDSVTNVTWYHYVIQCTNVLFQKGNLKGLPLILFESTQGYASADEAMQAFQDNYLMILRKGFNDANYGVGQLISLTEILVHETDDCNKNASIVFVRPETRYEFDGDTTATINALILLAKSYPVLYISNDRYRFSLYNKNIDQFDWRSMEWYSSPQEAMKHFQFFLSLLNYSGNIYIEKSETDCRYRIYIREVLALSINSYSSAADAWGTNGIEKFICVAQSEDGFHPYLNRKDCSNSFFVACGNTGLIHPCKYETPERRDQVLNKLYQAASFNFFDLLQTDDKNNISLAGLDHKPIATLFIQPNNNDQTDPCERLIQLFEAIYIDANYVTKDGTFYLGDSNKNRIALPASPDITLDAWKQQLKSVGCYFPLYRKLAADANANGQQQGCNFYIRIKLPGFNNCKDDLANDCPDLASDNDCNPGCYVGWKSDCCFSSCCEALLFYATSLKLMANFANYKPVYECNCGDYGIELHTEETTNTDLTKATIGTTGIGQWLCGNVFDPAGNIVGNQNESVNTCASEIVAINPQSYASSAIACDAIARATKLINSEGLHLTEHILLRPRCPEDCNCTYLPQPCVESQNVENPISICHFEWKPGGDPDPCLQEKTICFTPGCDPYSFIATIALPAWPARFRSAENKAVIEKLLQKEAPAHVLLRILWMNPRDFCCFEYYFRKWNYWLAKKMCDPLYNNCDFLGLLFHKNFEILADCNECVPCACNENQPVSCFGKENEIDPCDKVTLVSQLNGLYCWNKNDYDSYNCENINDAENTIPILKKATGQAKPVLQAQTNNQSAPGKMSETPQPAAAASDAPLDDREKYLLIQARYSKYTENVQKIVDAKAGNKLVEDALRFLSDNAPKPERYEELLNKILKSKSDKTKKITALTLKEKNTLIDNISWQYFDRVCLDAKNTNELTTNSALFNHLRKNKINMQSLYDDWNGNELKQIEPALNLNQIKKVVIGK